MRSDSEDMLTMSKDDVAGDANRLMNKRWKNQNFWGSLLVFLGGVFKSVMLTRCCLAGETIRKAFHLPTMHALHTSERSVALAPTKGSTA